MVFRFTLSMFELIVSGWCLFAQVHVLCLCKALCLLIVTFPV